MSHHYILGTDNQTKITKVKMFATFAGRACRYEGPAFKAAWNDPDVIVTDCIKSRPGDGSRPRPH